MLAWTTIFVFALWLVLAKNSPIYALITPPHAPDFTATGDVLIGGFGFSVESAGDVNDDGFGDVIVGADLANTIYVYTGSISGLTTTVFFSDTGLPGEGFGFSVAGGGDVNKDSVDDLVVGAPNGNGTTGVAYVYHGSASGLPTQSISLTGEFAGDNFGWSVTIIGDVDNNGIDDIAVGAPDYAATGGRVYIYYGALFTGVPSVPGTTLNGELALDKFGVSVAGAGDVNGDGYDDLIVGARENDQSDLDAGKAYVFYGSSLGLSQAMSDSVVGIAADNQFGISVHGAGDVNGDGFDDVIVGADATNPGDPTPGYFSVYPGGPDGLIPTPLFTQTGESDNDRFGFAVAGGGDLDGDGFSDFATGAYDFDTTPPITTTEEGKAYGYVACTNGEIAPSLIFSDTGESPADNYGHSLAIVNDVNGDSIDDLVVGAYGAKNSVPFPVGKVYAYYGVEGGCRPSLELNKTVGLDGFPTIYTNTSVITVPTDAVVKYNYVVTNTGNVTLTQHQATDDKLGIVAETAYTLTPGSQVAVNVTSTFDISVTPGISITNIVTWTGALSITSPSSVTIPANRVLAASAIASAQVNVSGPTTDQDGDGIPDNVEGSGNPDGDDLPNYLDLDSDNDGNLDEVEAGPDPTNPQDRNGNGIPTYLDDTENQDTNTDQAIAGLTIAGPNNALINDPLTFNAIITAGNNVSYTWGFGDGGTAIGQTVTHTYTNSGDYTVVVTATNVLGQMQATKAVTIKRDILLPRILTTGVQN